MDQSAFKYRCGFSRWLYPLGIVNTTWNPVVIALGLPCPRQSDPDKFGSDPGDGHVGRARRFHFLVRLETFVQPQREHLTWGGPRQSGAASSSRAGPRKQIVGQAGLN